MSIRFSIQSQQVGKQRFDYVLVIVRPHIVLAISIGNDDDECLSIRILYCTHLWVVPFLKQFITRNLALLIMSPLINMIIVRVFRICLSGYIKFRIFRLK